MLLFGIQGNVCMYRLMQKILLTAVLLMGILWTYHSHAQIESGQWYKGDLHAHSTHSDGDSPVADVIARAEDLGLNFFALTDHDTSMKGNPSHFSDPDYYSEKMVLLYGVEWTTRVGHANIWSSAPFSYQELWQANQDNDADAALIAAHNQEALFSINHPAASLCCPWEYPVESGIDSIEIWNSMYSLPNFSGFAVYHFWDDLLKSGRRIPGVGGSDTHHVKDWQSLFFGHGNPTTWVYAEEETADALLAGIKAGHVSISYAPFAVRLDFMADADGDGEYELMMGDNVVHESGQEISFKVQTACSTGSEEIRQGEVLELNQALVSGLEEGTVNLWDILSFPVTGNDENCNGSYGLGVFKNGTLYRVWLLLGGAQSFTFSDIPDTSTPTYYRAELVGIPQVFFPYMLLYGIEIALTNPIYLNFP